MAKRQLHKLDATDQAAGRLAGRIALLLRGKNKVSYQPHIDEGDMVEVANIDKMKFSGKKMSQKQYYHYSGYPGGLKTKKIINVKPAEVLKKAVRDMLPPTKHRPNLLKRLIIK